MTIQPKNLYFAPDVHIVNITLERGFAASEDNGFEQPEYGGSNDL